MYLGFSLVVLSLWKCYYLLETKALQRIWCEVFSKKAHKVLVTKSSDGDDDDDKKSNKGEDAHNDDDDDDEKIDIGQHDFRRRGSSRGGFSSAGAAKAIARAASRSSGRAAWMGGAKASMGSVRAGNVVVVGFFERREGGRGREGGGVRGREKYCEAGTDRAAHTKTPFARTTNRPAAQLDPNWPLRL